MAYQHDLHLVQSYLDGHRPAEEFLVKEISRIIRHLTGRMESRGSRFADVENVQADILYQVLVANQRKVIRNYQGESKLFTYLWPIIRNKIVDAVRKEMRRNRMIQLADDLDTRYGAALPVGSAEALIEEHISAEPPVDQWIKRSKWVNGMSYDEIKKEAAVRFPGSAPLSTQRIAYVLHTNRKALEKKLKNFRIQKRQT